MPKAAPRFQLVKPPKREAWSHAGKSTTERGYGWQHQKARARLLRDEPLCRECRKQGRITAATIADHVVPLAQTGPESPSALQPLCTSCHEAKTLSEALRGRTGGRGIKS